MSWFEEQLRYREDIDNKKFADAIDTIANAVIGSRLRDSLSQKEIASSAIGEILKFYHCKDSKLETPAKIDTVEKQIEYCMRPYGIKYRNVIIDKDWYNNAIGAMLGTLKEDGSVVALIPGKFSGYMLINIVTGKKIKVNRIVAKLLDNEAVCFYEPLPQKSIGVRDLLNFMLQQLSISDIVVNITLMGLASALGLLAPMFTKWIFSDVLESGSIQVLLSLAVFMVCYSITQLLFNTFKTLNYSRIGIKQDIAVQAAVMNRIMSMPPTFFRKYSSGELSQRATYVQSLCSIIYNSIGMTGLTSLFSLIYIGEIFAFTPSLVAPALLITFATLVTSIFITLAQIRITREKMEITSKTSGLSYATITGIQKIKLAGAEKRMFSRWAKDYAMEAELEYNPPTFIKISETITLALSLIGTMIIYILAVKSKVTVPDYYAFNTAYAMVSSAFLSVSSITASFANISPTLELAKPILETEPESHEQKENITELNGEIELSHISFKYDESMPNVINDLSLKIKPGEFLAVVGATGCGKSTLLRLLMGFESPQKGNIYYDKKDISKIDLESLRKQIGVVMQDGKLFQGDIYSNIVITAPELSMDDAWDAAKIASIADDIREMPMGMHTMISEGQGGISGGQKQRLMIARAIAPKPRILMFDEATSALDNITQKKISEAIDSLDCTRIIIAHRLSTIQHADRIIYLENGNIVENGTYKELIAKNGNFARLVERQRLDIED